MSITTIPEKQFDRTNSSEKELKTEERPLKKSGARQVPVYICGKLHMYFLRNGTTLAELLAQLKLDARLFNLSAGGKSGVALRNGNRHFMERNRH